MDLQEMTLGQVQTNCYLIGNEKTKEAVVIDPADEGAYIAKRLRSLGYELKAILLTHGHFDHITGAEELRSLTGTEIYAYEGEKELLADPKLNCSSIAGHTVSLIPDKFFKDKDQLELAGFTFEVLFTPGHTSGSVCFYLKSEGILFSGDTLFQESVGRSDLPTGNGRRLVKSVNERLLPLGEDILVYPGHGEDTTIGYEKRYNYYLK